MLRWISNLLVTKPYVTLEERSDELEECIIITVRRAIREQMINGQSEAFRQIMGHVELLEGQLASVRELM